VEAIAVCTIVVVATVLLAMEKWRADVVALLVLASLILLRVLEPGEAWAGFASPATITVASMFILSAGLQASGVVQVLADRFIRHGPRSNGAMLGVTAMIVAPISAFINNTAAVSVFLPIMLRACHERRTSPSRFMLALSFLAMLGGTCTLIGTSTNLIVSSIAEQHGQTPFAMFEFSKLGLVLLLVGVVYLVTIGQRLTPERVQADSLTQGFQLNLYLSEVIVLAGSPLVGKTLHEASIGERFDLEVLGQVRDKKLFSISAGIGALREDDILLVKASANALVKLRDTAGLAVRQGRRPGEADLRSGDSALIEVVVTPNSELEGRSLKSINFRNRYGATTLAIRRHGEEIREKIGHVRLRIGDELLVVAQSRNLERLRAEPSFVVLEELDVSIVKPVAAWTATLIVVAVVGVAAFGLYPIADVAVVGAVAMVLLGCLPVAKIYSVVDWRIVFLLAGLLPLGMALEHTGVAATAAQWIVTVTGQWGPQAALGAFALMAMLLTGVMSNVATAALLAPLAIACADGLEVDPRPFLVALTFAASAAFYTPIGYQTNLLVYGPGGYRFRDFVRVGGPLAALHLILTVALVPLFFPF